MVLDATEVSLEQHGPTGYAKASSLVVRMAAIKVVVPMKSNPVNITSTEPVLPVPLEAKLQNATKNVKAAIPSNIPQTNISVKNHIQSQVTPNKFKRKL